MCSEEKKYLDIEHNVLSLAHDYSHKTYNRVASL